MSDCTDCLLDLTDACPRGSGRAIDDKICDTFFQMNETITYHGIDKSGEAYAIEIDACSLDLEEHDAKVRTQTINEMLECCEAYSYTAHSKEFAKWLRDLLKEEQQA